MVNLFKKTICFFSGHKWTWKVKSDSGAIYRAGLCKSCGYLGSGEAEKPITKAEEIIYENKSFDSPEYDLELEETLRPFLTDIRYWLTHDDGAFIHGGGLSPDVLQRAWNRYRKAILRNHKKEIEHLAASLWVKHGSPKGLDKKFWFKSEEIIFSHYSKNSTAYSEGD